MNANICGNPTGCPAPPQCSSLQVQLNARQTEIKRLKASEASAVAATTTAVEEADAAAAQADDRPLDQSRRAGDSKSLNATRRSKAPPMGAPSLSATARRDQLANRSTVRAGTDADELTHTTVLFLPPQTQANTTPTVFR